MAKLIGVFLKKEGLNITEMSIPEYLPNYVINLDYNHECSDCLTNKNIFDVCDVCTLINNISTGIYGVDYIMVDLIAELAHFNHFDGFNTRIECQGCDDDNCFLKINNILISNPIDVIVNGKDMLYYDTIVIKKVD